MSMVVREKKLDKLKALLKRHWCWLSVVSLIVWRERERERERERGPINLH